jgi:hypothetical protein
MAGVRRVWSAASMHATNRNWKTLLMRKGHFTTDTSLIKIGHRLLSCLYATYDFEQLRRDDDPDPMDDFCQFVDEDVSEWILTLAAIARITDDEQGTLKAVEPNFPNGVGALAEGDKQTPLSIREACNKIIHATAVRYEFAWSEENPIWRNWFRLQGYEDKGQYKTPALLLDGVRQNGQDWSARVELVPFILAAAMWDMWKWKLA